jgi:DNA-binding GntR family transcriptional regulator
LIAAHRSPWSKHLLGVLYRHGERYRQVAIRMGAAQTIQRDVHDEHTSIYTAALARQEARAALALEAHIRLTCDILVQQAASRSAEHQAGAELGLPA